MSVCGELSAKNALLKAHLLRWMPEAGEYDTPIKDLRIYRRHETHQPKSCVIEPTIVLVVQGSKKAVMGKETYVYHQNNYLITGIDMPAMSYITLATPVEPYLALLIKLDPYLISQLSTDIVLPSAALQSSYSGVAVGEADIELLDAFLRLTNLLNSPSEIPFLAPMIMREIYYRLLTGPNGERLRSIYTLGSQSNKIAKAISWLKENYKEPLQIDTLAKMVNMVTSSFHRHFKEITSISPLQYQKRLRLYEAQRLMLVENEYATNAGLAVGYESPTQFSREYKRLFGQPPLKDVASVKNRVALY